MGEYRVMHIGKAYQIQENISGSWETIGEFDDLEPAREMVRGLRENG